MCQKITQATVSGMDRSGTGERKKMRDRFFRRERRGNEWIGDKGSLVCSRGENLTKILKLRFGHFSVWNNGFMAILEKPGVWWSF
jgi:ribosomal protein L44E